MIIFAVLYLEYAHAPFPTIIEGRITSGIYTCLGPLPEL